MTRVEKATRVFLKTIIRRTRDAWHQGGRPDWRRVGNQIHSHSDGVRFVARYEHRVPDGEGGNKPVHGVEIAA